MGQEFEDLLGVELIDREDEGTTNQQLRTQRVHPGSTMILQAEFGQPNTEYRMQ